MLNKDNAALVVIDIQDVLMPACEKVTASYLEQSLRMIQVVKALELPVLVTEQYPERLGETNRLILDALGSIPRLPKIEFSCFANDAFREAAAQTGRKQLLLIGMETHVCVMQTALEGLEQGYEVFIARDAIVSSREYDYKAGLSRMIQAGVTALTVEMAIFELLRKAGTPEFKRVLPIIKG